MGSRVALDRIADLEAAQVQTSIVERSGLSVKMSSGQCAEQARHLSGGTNGSQLESLNDGPSRPDSHAAGKLVARSPTRVSWIARSGHASTQWPHAWQAEANGV